jgi:segregation and condensation protein B
MLKGLVGKGLISELGRAEGPGRPILYGTTPEFLQHLGLNSIQELPPFERADADGNHDELLKG